MSHITMTVEQVRAHQERVGRQMAQRELEQATGPDPALSPAVRLVLPYPISTNRYYRSYVPRGRSRGVVVVSEEAREYRRRVEAIARDAGITTPMHGRISIGLDLYPERPKDWEKRARKNPCLWDNSVRSIDLDNALKVVLDSLQPSVIPDDKMVWRIVAERKEPDGDARAVVTVREI